MELDDITDELDIPISIKFLIAAIWDILDFAIGVIPFVGMTLGTIMDLIGVYVGIKLWGTAGLINMWELLLDPVNAFDAVVPTMTAIGVMKYMTKDKDESPHRPNKKMNYLGDD